MALRTNKLAAATAVAAAFSMVSPAPAAAVELPRPVTAKAFDGDALDAERDRRRRWGRHRDNGIDAGDVLAGVLILGGIAAIASAASKERAEDRYPARYPDDVRYGTPSSEGRFESRGIDRAVDMCVREVERGQGYVAGVDSANRDAEGWRVAGELESGASFWCTIDNSGRISGVGGSGTAYGEPVEDLQYDDDYYVRARAAQDGAGVDGDVRYDAGGSAAFD